MMEKALMIIMFMYCSSFGLLTAQYIIGDVVGEQISTLVDTVNPITQTVTPAGTPILPDIRGMFDTSSFNSITYNITNGIYTQNSTFYDKVETFSTAAASIGWLMVQLGSGTFVFNILALFGIPSILITGITVLYILLLARAILAYIRAV